MEVNRNYIMEEKKTRFVVYDDDFFGHGGRTILGHVNTLAEGQELLAERCKRLHFDDCDEMIKEIYSHTEAELVGRDSLTLYGSNCYFHEGIARVHGYVDEDEKETKEITLGAILKKELAEVGNRKWSLDIRKKGSSFFSNNIEFILQIEGQDKVFVNKKYEHIAGLPTHNVDNYYVHSGMGVLTINEKFNVDWENASIEEVDNRLREHFLSYRMFYSEEAAIKSLPDELVLDKSGSSISIAPYDRYGYHIENISAYCQPMDNGQGVYIHIRR